MRGFPISQCALSVSVAALFAGCGGPQLSTGVPGAMPQSRAMTNHADRGRSWMLPEARSIDLLYVSDGGNDVYVFSYPSGALVGTLTGFEGANGECVDKAGNIFVTNSAGYLSEYRHGGTTPFATLGDYGAFPVGCAIDPTTGNLAVTNYAGLYSSLGNVAVYKEARGEPNLHVDSSILLYNACSYDNKGNLYIDGNASSAFAFAELPKGSDTFTNITLNRQFQNPGAVLWDGRYIAIGTPNGSIIYRFKINGSTGTAVGNSILKGPVNAQRVFFWIQGDRVIVPFGTTEHGKSSVGFWRYPAGGRYARRLHGFGGQSLYGVTVSLAPSR